jgi:fucose 4-O-acetylase-like acetyltransferase
MEKKRNLTFDYVRGVAMLSIIVGHLYFYSGRYAGSLVFQICDTIQIPVFMYVSGLLAHVSVDKYGFRKLISSRVIRLLFPFFSFYIIWGLCDSSNWLGFWEAEFKKGYWFMLVLFELMISLSFIRQLSLRFNIKSILVSCFIFGLVTLYLFVLPKGSLFNQLLCINLYWHYYPFFMMGYYSYRLEKFLAMRYAPLFLVLYVFSFYFYQKGMRVVAPICNVSSLFFIMTFFSTNFKPLKGIFGMVGVNSLQVYMVHFFLLFPLVKVLPVIENRWLEFPFFVVAAVSLIAVTIGISKLLMKSDWLAMFLFGIKQK